MSSGRVNRSVELAIKERPRFRPYGLQILYLLSNRPAPMVACIEASRDMRSPSIPSLVLLKGDELAGRLICQASTLQADIRLDPRLREDDEVGWKV